MLGKSALLAVAALLATAVDASPFGGWGPFSHPGWQWPSVYTPPQPESTHTGWEGFPGHHTSTHEASVTTTVTAASSSSISGSSKTTDTSNIIAPSSTASPSVSPSSRANISYSHTVSGIASASGASSTSTLAPVTSASSVTSTFGASSGFTSVASASASSRPKACSKKSTSSGTTSISVSLTSVASASRSASGASASLSVGSSASGFTSVPSASGSSSVKACSKKSRSSGLTVISASSASVPSGTASRTRASGSVSSSGLVPSGTSSLSPCGSISSLLATYTKSSATPTPLVPAKLGYDCLNSIPFNQSAAVDYLNSIRPYLEWQTTIEYLKDPPAEYAAKVQPPYDFRANYERIYDDTTSGAYTSEYAFGFDLYKAFQMAHDGHFVVYPDSVTGLITFGRRLSLVSVSLDGVSIPEVYVYADVLAASFGNSSFTPSAITQINDQDATDFLLNFSQVGSLQDRDALWNNVFYEPAQVALGSAGTGTGTFSGSGRGRVVYPGPDTTLTFANGSSLTTQNFARVLVDFTDIQSGADLYQEYLTVPSGEPQPAEVQATSTSSAAITSFTSSAITNTSTTVGTTTSTATSIPAPGYPSPLVRETHNLNSGYFLEGAGYDDVAVLAVNSFVGTEADELPFQSVNTYLINQAVAQNKTKLIIDVSANGGGTILQGYDLFKQLFPTIDPYGANRFRAHEALDIIGQEFSAYSETVPRSLDTNATTQNVISSAFNYQTDEDVNGQPFTSWAEKYGPFAYGPEPDNFTSLFRWNLSDVLTPLNSGGIYVSGYLNRSNITTQPFAAENIVVVTDGYCASTCTIFSELMRQQAGVKYVALGGRPNKDITQAVGGVKGTNDFPYDYILGSVEQVFADPLLNTREYYNTTVLGEYNDLALLRSTAYVVNARDGIRKGDVTETPLQFVYEPADCRIYYTPEMTVDISASWRAVADSAFNGINHCIAGSLESGTNATITRKRGTKVHRKHSNVEKRELFDSLSKIHYGQGNTGSGDSIMII